MAGTTASKPPGNRTSNIPPPAAMFDAETLLVLQLEALQPLDRLTGGGDPTPFPEVRR